MWRWLSIFFGPRPGITVPMQSLKVDTNIDPVAWSSMADLLESLEAFGERYPELYDTDVREQLWLAFDLALLRQEPDFELPGTYGLFSDEANTELAKIVHAQIAHLKEIFAVSSLDTPSKRRVSFLNPKLHTEKGQYVDDFFGAQ
jgi:hypothetical protein